MEENELEQDDFDQWEYRPYTPITIQAPKNRTPGIVLLIVGAMLLLVGVGILFRGSYVNRVKQGEPEDICWATETGQYVYTHMQYMTEAVAVQEEVADMQYYIAWDSASFPAIVCIPDEEMETYQPYIDYLYGGAGGYAPREILVLGSAQPLNTELKNEITSAYLQIFGEEADVELFEEYIGEYCVQVGLSKVALPMEGIVFLCLGFAAIVFGIFLLYEKPVRNNIYGSGIRIDSKGSLGSGLLGALVGAGMGSVLWIFVGTLGFVCGWLGVVMVLLAYSGYKLVSNRSDQMGLILSVGSSAVMILLSTYFVWALDLYKEFNGMAPGCITLGNMLLELPSYISMAECWGLFAKDVGMGWLFSILAGGYYILRKVAK